MFWGKDRVLLDSSLRDTEDVVSKFDRSTSTSLQWVCSFLPRKDEPASLLVVVDDEMTSNQSTSNRLRLPVEWLVRMLLLLLLLSLLFHYWVYWLDDFCVVPIESESPW
jgi:hypothetical protein